MAEATGKFEIGVDIGGTFTDVVCRDGKGAMRLVKIPTTRRNPSAGVKAAMDYMQREWRVSPDEIVRFVHGTTVATNAVIEAKGAKIGLLTTVGFKDVLEIGRQMRHTVYDLVLKPETPVFLAPGALRKEVRERVTATGDVLVALDEGSVVHAVDELVAEGVEAIAVSYLFSFLNPAHERRTREIIAERHPQIMVSLSSRGRSCLPRVRAHLRDGVRCLHQAGGRTLSREHGAGSGGRRRPDAASDHAVARRHQLLHASPGSVRCGSSCRAPRPASSVAWRSAARPGSKT